MGNYDQLKNAVAAVIHDNGAEYITGDRLQDVLVTIINSVGAGATFAGVALPNTNPGTPDPNMFYLAGKAGTYTNFNVTITKGLWVFTNDGGTWTGTDLQVSMLFATGEDVTETSIAEDITQGASGDLPTVGAVRGALEAEDEKFFNEVAYGDIDDLATFDEAFAGSESGTPAYYTVYVVVGSHKVKVGTMEIISDNMSHVVTQVMVTHYVLDENGAITGAHSDGDLFRIFRSKKIHGGTLPTDDWTPWAYVNETEWKKIVSGADAVPTPDSEKLVKSGGVAAAIESLEAADEAIQGTFFNEVAYEDLGNIKLYIDTLAGSQSGTPAYYTVYKAVGDDKVKVGTLQVISDSSRGVLTQILETHYTLDGSGNLSAVVDNDHTFRIARSVTYSGGLVSLWSPWSYVNGSIVDEVVADASESLGNVNYLLAGCKGNVFDKTYVRIGKGIRNLSTYEDGTVTDDAQGCITCYYKIPEEADVLHIKGGASAGSVMKIRFVSEPSDTITNPVGATTADENVLVITFSGNQDYNIVSLRYNHPRLTYFCVSVYRDNQTTALGDFSITFEDTDEVVQRNTVEKQDANILTEVSAEIAIGWIKGFVGIYNGTAGEYIGKGSAYYMSQYIPVFPEKRYNVRVSGTTSNTYVVSFYSDKSFDSLVSHIDGDGSVQELQVVVPEGAAYMRIVKNEDISYEGEYGAASIGIINSVVFDSEKKYDSSIFSNRGAIQYSDGQAVTAGYRYTDFVKVEKGQIVKCKTEASVSAAAIAAYSSNDFSTYIKASSVAGIGGDTPQEYEDYVVPDGVNYLAFCCFNSADITQSSIELMSPGLITKTAILGNEVEELKETISSSPLTKAPIRMFPNAKLPCISFRFDDVHINDELVVELFDTYGLTCSFAFIASDTKINTFGKKYLEWCSKGYSVLSHSVNGNQINNENFPTDADKKQAIIGSKYVLEKFGFIVNGFSFPSGYAGGGVLDIAKKAYTYIIWHSGSAITRNTEPYNCETYSIESNTVAQVKTLIDNAITNDNNLMLYGHTANFGSEYQGETWNIGKVEEIIQYALTKRDNGDAFVGNADECVKYYWDL